MNIIAIVLITFFTFASSIKILTWQAFIFKTQLDFFKKYGLNRFHMFLVGVLELSAALLLTGSLITEYKVLTNLGALAIVLTSMGAVFFHLKFDTIKDAIPAFVTLTLSSILLAHNI